MKRDVKKIVSSVLFVVLIGLLVWYLYENRADLSRLLTLNASTVSWMLVLALAACVMNAVYHKLILDTYQLPLDLTDWMGVTSAPRASLIPRASAWRRAISCSA